MNRFRSITKSYFRRCDGVILVYDSTYERSFLNVREWIDMINESAPKKVSIMIIANKIDLRNQVRSEGKRVIEHDDGAKLAKVRLTHDHPSLEPSPSNFSFLGISSALHRNQRQGRYEFQRSIG